MDRTESADRSLLRVLDAKAAGTVAIFDKGDFYACYADDAVLLATEVFMSDVCLKTVSVKGDVMQYLTMNTAQYQRTVRELLMFMRYRIELYGLDADQWTVKAKGTIGNLGDFEDIIGEASGGAIMAVKLSSGEDNKVSAAFLDMLDFRVLTCEFIDSPLFSQIEHCVVGIAPRECLVFSDEGVCSFSGKERPKKLSALLAKVGVLETSGSKLSKSVEWEEAQSIFRSETEVAVFSDSLKTCVCGIYEYLKMGEQLAYKHKFSLSAYRTSGFAHVDAGAVRALELFALNYHQDARGASGTVFGLLNKCRTAPGQRLLREWIARPLCDLRQITERQDAVESLVLNSEVRQTLSDVLLVKVPDTSQLARKLILSKAKLQDCYRVYQLAVLLRHFENVLRNLFESDKKNAPAVKDLMLEPICYALLQFDKYCQLVRSTVDDDYYKRTGEFRIRPEIDPELLRISDEMAALEKHAEKARTTIASRLDLESIKLDSNQQQGFLYRVTLKDEKNIRKCKYITVVDTSKGGGVRFRDDTLTEINERGYEILLITVDCSQSKDVSGRATDFSRRTLWLTQVKGCVQSLPAAIVIHGRLNETYPREAIFSVFLSEDVCDIDMFTQTVVKSLPTERRQGEKAGNGGSDKLLAAVLYAKENGVEGQDSLGTVPSSASYQVLSSIYQTAQQDLEKKVIGTCAGYASSLGGLSATLATIDVLTSLSRLVTDSIGAYIRPNLEPMGRGVFELRKCRHPVLEALTDEPFIPSDIVLGENRMIILTGANMGGKSTYLRSAAISALLAQIGSFLPAAYARLSVVDGIFTRVGASDQQTRGISTFMAEMLESATILETATSNSLVIVDELGRGTSTYDGFGLAWAIATDLLKRVRCFCIFATHFHEMGSLAMHPGAVAMQMSVAIHDGKLAMLYEVHPGVAQSSYGIHVSRSVGFPDHIVEEASRILEELENPANECEIDEIIKKLKSASDEQLVHMLA